MNAIKDINLSYWEMNAFFKQFNLIVVGSGIVGLSTAISFREKNKKASILVLEKGLWPSGASIKNAGFACFGSAGEILDDLGSIPKEVVWKTLDMRWNGLQLLRKRIGDKHMDYKGYGGFELFREKKEFEKCREKLGFLNRQIYELIGVKDCYTDHSKKQNLFKNTNGMVKNHYEGQLNTALMMSRLLQIALENNIQILNNIDVKHISESPGKVEIESQTGVFKADKVVVCTNGFAKQLLNIKDVEPARAQVLITKPIKGLKIKGAFHFDKGFYYFRNIHNRILFGGGRNLDIKKETTFETDLNPKIQNSLNKYLKELILPNADFEIDQRWTGIMGVGKEKLPVIKKTGKNVLAAVRMGGMGIAIGSMVGKQAAEKIH
jgi:gamma-glutamylputrescine oxidase